MSLWVVSILLSKIKVIAIGIIGVRENPRTLHRMFMLRKFKLPLSVNTVPASDRIIIIVRIMPIKNGFLRWLFNAALEYNNHIKKKSAAMSMRYVAIT